MPKLQSDKDRAIRERAYFTWLREGRPEGRALDHWLFATIEQLGEDSESDGEEEQSPRGPARREYPRIVDERCAGRVTASKSRRCRAISGNHAVEVVATHRDRHRVITSGLQMYKGDSPTSIRRTFSTAVLGMAATDSCV